MDEAGRYRVVINDFLAEGGDNFSVLRQGEAATGAGHYVDALEAYFAVHSPVKPPLEQRIRRMD